MPVPILTVRNFPSMPEPHPANPTAELAGIAERSRDPASGTVAGGGSQGGSNSRTALPRAGCGYCNTDGHGSQFCYDPHQHCPADLCRVPGNHRHYRPLHRCRASPFYDANTDRDAFLASQRATHAPARGARATGLRTRTASHLRGSRGSARPPYPRPYPSATEEGGPRDGPPVRSSSGANRRAESGRRRSYSARTRLTLPANTSSADGYPIDWAHVERIIANNGWRLNDVSRQMAIDMFPNMIIAQVLRHQPARAVEHLGPHDWQPGEHLIPDYANVLDDIDLDYEAEDRGD